MIGLARRIGHRMAPVALALSVPAAGVLLMLGGCAGPASRAEMRTVAHLDNRAYVRYASVWSQHTFDSPLAEARLAIVTADPALHDAVVAADTTSGTATGTTQDGAAGGSARAEALAGTIAAGAAQASADDEVAGAGSADATARGRAVATDVAAGSSDAQHLARAEGATAGAGTADAAERGDVAAQQARGAHAAAAHTGSADAAAHGARADAAAVAGQTDARAAGARVDVIAQRPHLVLRKTAHPVHALPGDRVRFTFHLHNPGPLVVERVRVIDELPDDLAVVGVGGAELKETGDGDYHLHLAGRIPVGGSRTVTLETRLSEAALDALREP